MKGLADPKTDVGEAIRQARGYADDAGIEYAAATNGAQWLVFRAIVRGSAWLDGRAVIFRSLEDIDAHFIEFWNLLSIDAIGHGSLPATLGSSATQQRVEFIRPIQNLSYADAPLERNHLASQLQPLITTMFSELAGWRDLSVLRDCYVWERDTREFQRTVDDAAASSMPMFAKRSGFHQLVSTAESSGTVDDVFRRAVDGGKYGTTMLLLGKIGSGKTTLLQRLISITAPANVRAKSAFIYVPFTDAPPDPAGVEAFIRKHVLAELKERHPDIQWTSSAFIRGVYREELAALREGVLEGLSDSVIREREAEYLSRATETPEHTDRILKFLRSAGVPVILILDNMDHHSPRQQEEVFLHAHAICRTFDAIVLVALREETFFRGMQAGAFNAYSNIRFHVSPPDVRKMLVKRIQYVLDACEKGRDELQRLTRTYIDYDLRDIKTFLRVAQNCLGAARRTNSRDGYANPAIAQFLDNLSHGNMRGSLDMFAQYLVSGATKVNWIIDHARGQGGHRVAEHEFIKAVMLGDYKFYRDSRSAICNLFEVSASAIASNLTSCRLLRYLARKQGAAHEEGPGYVSIDACIAIFSEIFGDADDVTFHAQRLLRRRIVEVDTRYPDSLVGARAIRITRAGLYYLNILCRRFQYLDLVCLDTPVCSASARQALTGDADSTDMYDRIRRTETLLSYLDVEEQRSLRTAPRELVREHFGDDIVPGIREHYDRDLQTRVLRGARVRTTYADVLKLREQATKAAHEPA